MTDHAALPTRAQDMFCFATYVASHCINRAYAPLLKPLGLTYPKYITLTLLWDKDWQSIGELASHLKMETSTVTPLVKRLEAMAHVRRQRGTQDERQVFVHLTASGKKLQKSAPQITACMVEATGLELSELDSVVATLGKLVKNLTNTRNSKEAAGDKSR